MSVSERFIISDTYGPPRVRVRSVVTPDEHIVTREQSVIGAYHVSLCLALSIMDRENGVFSLAHVMWGSPSRRIPSDTVVDKLVEEIEKQGGRRDHLEAYLAGEVRQKPPLNNSHIIAERLRAHHIPLRQEDIGGSHTRNVYLYVPEGRVEVYRLFG